jgi:AcrR family transcriptional regulator
MRSRGERTFTEGARRAQIVDCAIEVMAEVGYTQASIRKIADRVGVAMSVVLYHFTGKDELVGAIVAKLYGLVIAKVLPALEAEQTAAGKFCAYIRANAAYIAEHTKEHGVILDIGMTYRSPKGKRLYELGLPPELLEQLVKLDLESILRLDEAIRTRNPRLTAVAVQSALNGAMLEVTRDPEFDVLGYGEELVTLFEPIWRTP